MQKVILITAVLFMATAVTTPSYAEISAEKKELVREFLEMSGVKQTAVVMADGMFNLFATDFKKKNPNASQKTLNIIKEEISAYYDEAFASDSYYNILYPIYDKHFTSEELVDIMNFYKTPTGKKTLKVMPIMMQESIAAGQVWGQAQVPAIQARLTKALAGKN